MKQKYNGEISAQRIEKEELYEKYYDKEIELCADYRPKQIARPEDVWQSVANIQNIYAANVSHVKYACELVTREKHRDFQRRF